MNIKSELLKEQSKAQVNKVVKFIGSDKNRFQELVTVFLGGPYRVTQRAAWPMTYCVQMHPALVAPHLSRILAHLKKPGIHDAVKRNIIRMLQFIEIPPRLQSRVTQLCFTYLSDKKEAIAIRVFSMTVLANLSIEYPELKKELIFLIEEELPYAGAAFRSRARKVLKQLSRN